MVAFREDGQGYFTFEEVASHPVVVAVVKKFRKEDQEKVAKRFYLIQKKHYFAWESESRRKQHSLDNIEKIEWNRKEQCFHVFYKETEDFSSEWYHYTWNGEWY